MYNSILQILSDSLRNRKIFFSTALNSLTIILCVSINSCIKKNTEIYGTYRYYSDDPIAMQMMTAQNTYLELSDGETIIYHTEINGKKTFHNQGFFTFDEKKGMLHINWETGKVPDKLKIEKQGDIYIIKVGSTIYKKEKENNP